MVTVYGSDKEGTLDFYIIILGMYLKRTVENLQEDETCYLFTIGNNQLEVRCADRYASLPPQQLTLACNNSEYLRQRIIDHGLTVSDYRQDPYSAKRTFSFTGPDRLTVTAIEEE